MRAETVFQKMYLNNYLEKVRDNKNTFLKYLCVEIKAFQHWIQESSFIGL